MTYVCVGYPCQRTAAGCPICDPPPFPLTGPIIPPLPVVQPQGCVCPPTSEKTCENPTCPRKRHEARA
jgi:hypothetical protein